jgi:hypothetical protein
MQVAYAHVAAILCLTLPGWISVGMCTTQRTHDWFKNWYHLILLLNVLPIMLGDLIISIRDERDAPFNGRCPQVYSCPHHAIDVREICF